VLRRRDEGINGIGVDGNNPVTFTIDVVDNGEPGKNDTFKITLSDSYSKGPSKLLRGNIQVHS
jgi:hypothetical protein